MSSKGKQRIQKKTFMAMYELEKRNIEPIEFLHEVYKRSIDAFDKCRGLGDKGDSGPGYLAQALGAAKALATFKYPTLTAVAIKDLDDQERIARPLSTAEAIEIIKKDPFAPPELKKLDTFELLPIGKTDASK